MFHDVRWTDEEIARFWDFYGRNRAADHKYFGHKLGGRILGLAERHARLEGPVLDLGCGRGHLTEQILDRGYPCLAVDQSSESVAEVQQRLAGRRGFLGARTGSQFELPLGDGEVGTVFLLEVLEHLSPEKLERALAELARVLRPGGHLVVTVPHDEDLDAARLACPECGAVFHQMQHQQRFDGPRLEGLVMGQGFQTVFLRALNFRYHPDRWFGGLVERARRAFPVLGGYKLPVLMLIARRS